MEASEVPVGITLLKYNQIVKDVIFCTDELQNVWVTAELSDVGGEQDRALLLGTYPEE
jgi:hypothetical protein